VDNHPQRIDLWAKGGIVPHTVDDLANASKQPGIIQYRLTDAYAVVMKLTRFTD
jgi:hypothetical protein